VGCERTFGWLTHYRRLSKDYEVLTETSEAMIYAATTRVMLRRLGRRQAAGPLEFSDMLLGN